MKLEPGDHVRRIAQEREVAWRATEQAGVPLIVSPKGDILIGCMPTEEIVQFFGRKYPARTSDDHD